MQRSSVSSAIQGFQNETWLRIHVREAGPAHRTLHAARCTIPGCNSRDCVRAPFECSGVGSPEVSSSIRPPPTLSTASSPPARSPVVRRKVKTGRCYICGRSVKGKENGLQMHMRASKKHASLHSKACPLKNCDPTKCFGGPIGNVSAPMADSAGSTLGKYIKTESGADSATTPPEARRIVEPGPPDPKPTPTVPLARPPSKLNDPAPTSLDAHPTPLHIRGFSPAVKDSTAPNVAPHTASSQLGHTLVEPGPPELIIDSPSKSITFPQFYHIQEGTYDYVHGVTYDASGNGWCMHCHGPWIDSVPPFLSQDLVTGPAERSDQTSAQNVQASNPVAPSPKLVTASSPSSPAPNNKSQKVRKEKKERVNAAGGSNLNTASDGNGNHEAPAMVFYGGKYWRAYCHGPVYRFRVYGRSFKESS
ncbi:hypothetical protein BKA70DRAFT_1272699 [Coprinopsis sp. MPI-PUGE-AT-0042]|nr:hypothetical protein BKA70DRAFT_1272699 [Coprinopsis sp. MPI-PUGE-AT-0042]